MCFLRQAQEISARYGVLKEDLGVDLRGLFIINPEGGVEHITMNGLSVGRNVDEAKRLVQAIQFVAEYGEVLGGESSSVAIMHADTVPDVWVQGGSDCAGLT